MIFNKEELKIVIEIIKDKAEWKILLINGDILASGGFTPRDPIYWNDSTDIEIINLMNEIDGGVYDIVEALNLYIKGDI